MKSYSYNKNLCLSIVVGIFIIASSMMLSVTATDPSKFVGEWKLKEVWDNKENAPIQLPSNEGPFILRLISIEQTASDASDNDNETLNLYVKVGNTMRSSVEFLDDNNANNDSSSNNIRVGDIMKTLMWPGSELMQLENYLSKYLPQMTSIELGGRGETENTLIMTSDRDQQDGGAGQAKIVCEAVEASQA